MYKFIAILFIFCSCTIIGLYQSAQLARRKALLHQYRDLLQHMETEMGYFKDPLPVILQKMHKGTNQPADLLLRQCLFQMEQGSETIADIWERAIGEAYDGEPLNASDLTIMTKCGSFLGQSDYQGQKGHFALLQGELNGQIDDATANCKTKGTLYTKAGISVGAVIAIALL